MRGAFASLTSRLVLTTVAIVLLVSLVIGAATSLAMRSYLTHQLDEDVRATTAQLTRGPGPESAPGFGTPADTLAAQFVDGGASDGMVLRVDDEHKLDRVALSSSALDELKSVPIDDDLHTVHLAGVGSYRVLAIHPPNARIVIGLPTHDVDDALATLIWWEVLLALLAVAAGGGAALAVVRRQLRPLREVAATAHRVAELPLASEVEVAERVPGHLTDERTEVGQVGHALNTLLSHVETSLAARQRSDQQVRQFVADAAHELRTPLATIAGYAELAHRRPEETGTALDKVEAESRRMTALVEDLLLLARLDAGRPLERETVDLTRLLLESVSDARVLAPGHHWRLDLPDQAVEVTGDGARLHQVVSNLLTNARTYTPDGTTVTVRARPGVIEVHDDGPGFPPEVADRAFERFVRADTARSRTGGTGLGLALVEAIVTAHGGTVTLDTRPGDTTVRVDLRPLSPGQRPG